jgi:predicted DNA-binding transcriptional regulator AlpA
MIYITKRQIAERFAVTTRCVDGWRARGLLPDPIKLGTADQARVRWPAEAVAQLEAKLRGEAA